MQEKFKTLPRKKSDKCNLNNILCLERKAKKTDRPAYAGRLWQTG
jgi:hypothetical protein